MKNLTISYISYIAFIASILVLFISYTADAQFDYLELQSIKSGRADQNYFTPVVGESGITLNANQNNDCITFQALVHRTGNGNCGDYNAGCRLLIREHTAETATNNGFDPSYDNYPSGTTGDCTATPWLTFNSSSNVVGTHGATTVIYEGATTADFTASNGHNAAGVVMFGIGCVQSDNTNFSTNINDSGNGRERKVFEAILCDLPAGRYTAEIVCSDFTDSGDTDYARSWKYEDCGGDDIGGSGDLFYFTVGQEGIFREILIFDDGGGEEFYFINSLQPDIEPCSDLNIEGTGTGDAICPYDNLGFGFEANTYKNTSDAGNVNTPILNWQITSSTPGVNDTPMNMDDVTFRDPCGNTTDGPSRFGGGTDGGSCLNGAPTLSQTNMETVEDQRWQISGFNSNHMTGLIDIDAAIEAANPASAGQMPTGIYTLTGQVSAVTAQSGTLMGTSFSKTFTVATGVSTCALLPIELTQFEAKYKSNQQAVNLNWSTASEENNSHFEVQHSTNGKNWKGIGKVDGRGTSLTIQHYTFQHSDYEKGTNYYRLKQVDFDNKFEYSHIVNVKIAIDKEWAIYPNPANTQLTIESSFNNNVIIKIMDSKGRIVQKRNANTATIFLDVASLNSGIYSLIIIMENGDYLADQQFVKL